MNNCLMANFCNQQVAGSSPITGLQKDNLNRGCLFCFLRAWLQQIKKPFRNKFPKGLTTDIKKVRARGLEPPRDCSH